MFKLIMLITLTSLSPLKKEKSQGKINWVGHWESYSWNVEGKLLGTIDITKSGKNYRIKYSYQCEANREGSDEPCHALSFEMDAEYDGKTTLNADFMGFTFDFNEDMNSMFVEATSLDPMFGPANCVSGIFSKAD